MSVAPTEPTTSPFCLPLHVHPDAQHVVIDADANTIAECGEPFKYSGLRPQRIKWLHDAESYAAEIVRIANAYPELMDVIRDLLDGLDLKAARVNARSLLLKLEMERRWPISSHDRQGD